MNSSSPSLDLLTKRVDDLTQENLRLKEERENGAMLKRGSDGTTSDGMDLLSYKMEQYERRADAADARMARVEDKLGAIQLTLAGLATKDSIRNWGIAIAAIVVATGLAVGAMMLQAAGNQLSAFQAGLSAIQTVVSASQLPPSHPVALPAPSSPSKPGG